jgi:hypothetical protein
MLFSGTADVQAAKKSKWKTITLTNTFRNTKMVLSQDGETLTCYYSKINKDGSERTSVDLKSALPAEILKKFGDGEVYMYKENDYANWEVFWEVDEIVPGFSHKDYVGLFPTHKETEDYDCEKGAEAVKEKAAAYKEELDKSIKYNTVTMTHEVDNDETEHTSAADEDHEGAYVITWDDLCSSTGGTGEVEIDKIDDEDSYYLADKNGNRIVSIGFEYRTAVEGVAYVSYDPKSTMELSGDGKTLIATIAWHRADGTVKKSVNLKKLLPADILAQFEDGEVYLYQTGVSYKEFAERTYVNGSEDVKVWEQSAKKIKKEATAYKKKLLAKGVKYNNVKMEHYVNFAYFDEYDSKGKHTAASKEGECDGEYVVSWENLFSSSKGTGAITPRLNNSLDEDKKDYSYLSFGSYYLADKNGNKIINIEFQSQDYSGYDLGTTCNLREDYESLEEYHFDYLLLKSGESFSEKIHVSGTAMAGSDCTDVRYDSKLLTVKKDGTVTAKKGKYGITVLYVGDESFRVFITDGSSKMLKALEKTNDGWGYENCVLTVGKNGKYTIKKS